MAGTTSWEFQDNNTFMPSYTCLDCQDHIRDMGLVNLHRIPRPLYFFYRSQQDQEPFVYIANRWTKASPPEVTVFGNCSEVELTLNGKSLARQGPDSSYRLPPPHGPAGRAARLIFARGAENRKKLYSTAGLAHPPFTFSALPWEAGELRAECFQGETKVAEDVVRTPGEPATIQLEPDYSELVADGADLTRVVVSVRDRNGTIVPERKRMIELSAKGKGRLIGDQPLVLENGLAAVYLQAGLPPGHLELSATASGLAPARLVITTLPLTEPTVPLPDSNQ